MKKSIFITALIILTLFYIYVFSIVNYNELNFIQRRISISIVQKFEQKLNSYNEDDRKIIDYEELLSSLNVYEKQFAKRILKINPNKLGITGRFYSLEKPKKLIKIESKRINDSLETGVQYLPLHVFNDYIRLNNALFFETGKKLYIDSGYRSPGRQAYLFFKYLVTSSNFSLKENAKWIAFPGYSEHGDPINTAVDFINTEGIDGFSRGQTGGDFEKLKEYSWLLNKAQDYNFQLSYKKDNQYGVGFEPWHWHWGRK